jgi:uncharacterized membrane protein
MRRSATDYVLYSQLSLYVCILICLLIMPQFLFSHDQGGVSNYGIYAKTVFIYSLGFVAAAGLLLKASTLLGKSKRQRSHSRALRLLAVLYIVNLVSTYPYKVDHVLDTVHIWAAVVLLSAEMVMGIWLTYQVANERIGYSWLLVQIVGFILLVLTFWGKIHLLFIGEVWPGVAFGALLVRATDLLRKSSK